MLCYASSETNFTGYVDQQTVKALTDKRQIKSSHFIGGLPQHTKRSQYTHRKPKKQH